MAIEASSVEKRKFDVVVVVVDAGERHDEQQGEERKDNEECERA